MHAREAFAGLRKVVVLGFLVWARVLVETRLTKPIYGISVSVTKTSDGAIAWDQGD